jgi:hypothetical protein
MLGCWLAIMKVVPLLGKESGETVEVGMINLQST